MNGTKSTGGDPICQKQELVQKRAGYVFEYVHYDLLK